VFITKNELDTCLFRFIRIVEKLEKKRPFVRTDYYYINIVEYFTKMPLINNGMPSNFAKKVYKKLKNTSNRVEEFLKILQNKGFNFKRRQIRGKEYIGLN